MGKRFLITGGAGFIGCALSQALEPTGAEIVAVDPLHPQIHPDGKRPAALPASVRLETADIRDRDFWRRLFDGWRPDVLVHFAAETGTGQSLTEAGRHAGVNVLGTAEVMDAMTAAGIEPEHVLLSSSRAVYGEGAWIDRAGGLFYPRRRTRAQLEAGRWGFVDPTGFEASPARQRAGVVFPTPTSVYGATKLTQEHLLEAWCAARSTPLSVLRFQNVYGPGQSPFNAYTGIINLFHRVARAGQSIDVYEDGAIGRDFVFIDDVVAACVAALGNPPAEARTLDVGSGTATTIHEAASTVAALHGAPVPHVSGKFRDGDVRWAVSDTTAMAADLGVVAKVDFAEGCRRVGEWLVANGFA